MRLNKKGIGKNVLLSLLIGIPTVALILLFLSQGSSQAGVSGVQCRQSLLMRNVMPEQNIAGTTVSIKDTLPLKCGTQTININYKNVAKAESEIAKTIGSCWYMVGKGTFRVFPGTGTLFGKDGTPCIICARIHLNEKVKDYYDKNAIDIEKGLSGSLQGNKRTALEYLNPQTGKKAFMYFKGWSDKGFSFEKQSSWPWSSVNEKAKVFNFPKYLEPNRGDLFVVYAEPVKGAFGKDKNGESRRSMEPYMILTQYSNFDKLSKTWAVQIVPTTAKNFLRKGFGCDSKNPLNLCSPDDQPYQTKVCSSIESVPS